MVSMAGLVRSEVEFAGGVEAGPSASRATRWQAPLQSADPPGVDVDALPRPVSGRGVGRMPVKSAADSIFDNRYP